MQHEYAQVNSSYASHKKAPRRFRKGAKAKGGTT